MKRNTDTFETAPMKCSKCEDYYALTYITDEGFNARDELEGRDERLVLECGCSITSVKDVIQVWNALEDGFGPNRFQNGLETTSEMHYEGPHGRLNSP